MILRIVFLFLFALALPSLACAQSCTPNNNTSFTINGNTLSSAGPLAASSYTAGVVVQMPGVSNSGLCVPLTIIGQTILPGGNPTIMVNGLSSGITVSPGVSVTVAVTGGPGNPGDWVGLCADNTTCNTLSDWAYIDNGTCTQVLPTVASETSGSCSLKAPTAAGTYTYYADFFPNNQHGGILANVPFTVTSGAGTPTITANGSSSGATVAAGSSVAVAVTNGPGNPTDWIGLCTDTTACNTFSDWAYLANCKQTSPASGLASNSCNLNAASPSSNTTYYADFFPNNQHSGILASASFTVTAGTTSSGSCTSSVGYNDGSTVPCPVGSQAGGPAAPPSGYHWNLVWYDNFYKDSSLDLSKWCNIYLNDNASCTLTTNLAFDSTNGLSIYASPPSSNNNIYVRSGIIESDGNGVAGSAPGSHIYGIWEWSIKQPTDVSGEGDEFHSDVWFHSNHGFNGYPASPAYIEWDVGEKANGIYATNSTELWCGACNNSNYNTENVYYPDGDLSANFHTLSGYWIKDSNPAGSAEVLFDGVLQFPNNSPTPLQNPSYWLNGLWNTITLDGCNPNSGLPCSQQTLTDATNNPFRVRYARYWQLAPN